MVNEPGCKICSHPKVAEINAALAAGNSLRKVAAAFASNKDLLQRHWQHSKASVLTGSDQVTRLNNLKSRIEKNLARAEKAEDFKMVQTLTAQILEIESKLMLAPAKAEEVTTPRATAVQAVREALGFEPTMMRRPSIDLKTGKMSLDELDQLLVEELLDAAEAHADDPRLHGPMFLLFLAFKRDEFLERAEVWPLVGEILQRMDRLLEIYERQGEGDAENTSSNRAGTQASLEGGAERGASSEAEMAGGVDASGEV